MVRVTSLKFVFMKKYWKQKFTPSKLEEKIMAKKRIWQTDLLLLETEILFLFRK